ncbi:translation initiation factor eIF3 subunit [Umbelopsis sp. PMI_123]|nr:translation initiation factor eIF3 subunit [Umbelopsis sp. PMI_123]
MSDWENDFDEDEPVVPVVKKKWDDEDVEDDIKDSWEESDEEEKPEPAAAPVKKKIPLAQKIAERQAEEEKKKLELEAKRSELASRQQPETDEEAFERKEREKRLQIEADIQNASDLFSGVAVVDGSETIETMKPVTKEQFEAYQKRLVETISSHQKAGQYKTFLENFIRELCLPIKDLEVRKISSTLTALANEKQRQQREAAKPKKKGKEKPSLQGNQKTVGRPDTAAYDNFDDFDDFM